MKSIFASQTVGRLMGAAALTAALLAPRSAWACACGCGVFDVATSSMLPQGQGGMLYLQYDYQDQTKNWSGFSQAPAADNDDKDIRTSFFTAGLQYMFNRSWGVHIEVPYDSRSFTTTGGPTGDQIVTLNWSQLGDIRINAIYTGFSDDLSSGITFGIKLPNGNYKFDDGYGDADRDSELGTGSTDLLLGGFWRRALSSDEPWTGFAQIQLDIPTLTQVQYQPGDEADAAEGVYYTMRLSGPVKLSPLFQLIESLRTRDNGNNAANPVASGYERLILSPGIELDAHPMSFYADLEFPVVQHFTGEQLVAPVMVKVSVSYMF
jgi:hypothetical protein